MSWKNFLKTSLSHISDLLFPPLCATCGDLLPPEFHLFCENCMESLSLLEKEGRCATCFCPKEPHTPCDICKGLPGGLCQAACFEESPVSNQLLTLLRQGIAVSATAGYMAYQLEKLRWPIPDLIVPTPGDWFEKQKDKRMRKLIAKELALLFSKPYGTCLQIERHLFPIRHEPLESQPTFTSSNVLYSSFDVANKTILLVHDAYKTGRALALCAKALKEKGARTIYGLSLIADSSSTLLTPL